MKNKYTLHFFTEVSADIRNTKKWYREQQEGLEKRFETDVKLTLSRIAEYPLNYEIKYRNVRIAFCRIFPYGIHFYLDEETGYITVIAVMHQHRNPEYTQKRI